MTLQPHVQENDSTWEGLERQDWHLWILAVFLLFVLGISLLSFMFPTVFWLGGRTEVAAPQRAFFGFSILLALTLVYMLQRQATIRRLKRSLYLAHVAATEAEDRALAMSFSSLPEVGQFRDSLAMEYRRASHAGDSLAIILLSVAEAPPETLGKMTQALREMLRARESIFRVSDNSFGLILPGLRSVKASALSSQIRGRMNSIVAGNGMSEMVLAYPEHAGSLAEMEGCLRTLVAQS